MTTNPGRRPASSTVPYDDTSTMSRNVSVSARLIESRPKRKSCVTCTVNSTIVSSDETVNGRFALMGSPSS